MSYLCKKQHKSNFAALRGLVIEKIEGLEVDSERVEFHTACGRLFQMYHEQNCCEHVYIADVVGDVYDLVKSPITMAEESSREATIPEEVYESGTWTFYKLATIKGYVDIRWLGKSNGYYGEGVSFFEVKGE
ncbi:hypothetical protein FDI24_gp230 [Acidovorax phage ACP17]|uniref:DUF7448 domain-containing protein n=1 Tax=Acidovorax phage ACP17 TaxID=2010329 RepID=A0A218M396_9CAUD|nr:hypothetical protein FDI24_gp230 [Acidovorax phage ACP17]ASD50511.1 hypothetical protein [Acidovorax phage ACP17]